MWYIYIGPELWFTIVLIFSINPPWIPLTTALLFIHNHTSPIWSLSANWVSGESPIILCDSFCQQTKTLYNLYDLDSAVG